MPQTPWLKGGAGSSLLSDRISPRPVPSQQSGAGPGKDRQSAASAGGSGPGKQVKSPEVLRLESLVKALNKSAGTTPDPKGGCFCLARDHPLSDHVSICQSCGLILCSINLPQFACPFCSSPLLSSEERKFLIADLEQQILDALAREAEVRERAVVEAKRAAGAFPTLSDTMKQQPRPRQQQQKNTSQDPRMNLPPLTKESHKVMSLRTKPGSNKVVISSYTSSSSSPSASRPASARGSDKEKEKEKDDVKRVPRPAHQPKHSIRKVDPSRPWENLLLEGNVAYIPPSRVG